MRIMSPCLKTMITAAEMFFDASIGGYRDLFLTTKPNFGIVLPLKSEFPAMYLVKLFF